MNKELEELLVDEEALDKESLASILKPYVRIDKATGEISLLPPAFEKSNDDKVILYFLARKARRLLLKDWAEEASHSDALRDLELPAGSVKTSLRRLSLDKILRKRNGKYYIPNYMVPGFKSKFEKGVIKSE